MDRRDTERMSRRSFLSQAAVLGAGATGVGALLGSREAAAAQGDDPSEFVFARYKYANVRKTFEPWDCWQAGDQNFLAYLRTATNIKVSRKSYDKLTG